MKKFKKIFSLVVTGMLVLGTCGCQVFPREDKAGQEYYNNLKKEVAEYETASEKFSNEISKQTKNANTIADTLIKESEDIINIDTPEAYVNVQNYYVDIATYSKQMAETYKKYVAEKDKLKKINYMEDIKEISQKRDEVITKLQNLQKSVKEK